jgi:hypothetical protein
LIVRSFFLFDTSSIGAGYAIDAATLSLYGYNKSNAGVFGWGAQIYGSNPASNTALVSADYAAVSRVPFSDAISYAAFDVNGYNDWTLNSSGLAAIDPEGISKFSSQSVADASDTEPTWSVNGTSESRCFAADELGTSRDPKLVVTFSSSDTFRPIVVVV